MSEHTNTVERKLPADFYWGFASASYQVEGSPAADGRLPSIWDTFTHTPGRTVDGTNGDEATESYKLWREDIALLKSYGATAYRFSLAWSRIIPKGSRHTEVNQAGIAWYRQFVTELLANGIRPFVTLYHWDLPQALQDAYGGWINKEEITKDFAFYAKTCFNALGDLVKDWVTLNEPWCTAWLGYGNARFAPGRSSNRDIAAEGDTSTEPWLVAHNQIVAHAYAVREFNLFKSSLANPSDAGCVGITLDSAWYMPWDDSPENVEAAKRAQAFKMGFFADPIYKGVYPPVVKAVVGSRLPDFTPEELDLLKDCAASEFFGLNTYTSHLIKNGGGGSEMNGDVTSTFTRPDGTQLGKEGNAFWLQMYAPGFKLLLEYVWKTYGKKIIIFESGFAPKGEANLSLEEAIHDKDRVEYYDTYLNAMLDAVAESGVRMGGYFAWTMLDNFEWSDGYTSRFGVTFVDRKTQKRTPKDSAGFIRKFFTAKGLYLSA